eukprot:m.938914 g.938914  ORF g.938914 m.938914 type:complete len:70 (-) comp23822_c0_seq7:1238-1447(-)
MEDNGYMDPSQMPPSYDTSAETNDGYLDVLRNPENSRAAGSLVNPNYAAVEKETSGRMLQLSAHRRVDH